MSPPSAEGSSPRREIGLDDVVEHFTLGDHERELLRNKSGSTRLGFAAMLKFLGWKGRFPRGRFELPDDAIEHLARQAKVSAVEIGAYDFAGRQIKNHRREIGGHTGFRICSVSDAEAIAGWLATHIAQDERRVEHVRALLLGHCKHERIEPPTPERAARIVDSGIRQADAMLVATVVARLKPRHVAGIEALLSASVESDVETTAGDGEVEPEEDALSAVKASPGNVSLATMIAEMSKLQIVRQVDLPPDLFTGTAANVVAAWRARAAVESPSHLARHDQPVRLVLLAALLHLREREITDTLVELLNQTVHKINARVQGRAYQERYPLLAPTMTRPIRWELIEQNYDASTTSSSSAKAASSPATAATIKDSPYFPSTSYKPPSSTSTPSWSKTYSPNPRAPSDSPTRTNAA